MALNKKEAISIRRRQLDVLLSKLAREIPKRPKHGWVREIRELLLMTKAQLARRLNIDPSTLVRLEQSENKKSISLGTLERLADKMECELHYVLVPKRRLGDILSERAEKLLRHEESRVERSMGLEGQGGAKRNDSRRALEKASMILNGNRRLWDE